LRGADLGGANLGGANLGGANLGGANLRGANLGGAKLKNAKNIEAVIAATRILPAGHLIGWKKARNGDIIEIEIPMLAQRSHAFGRKCRAEYAVVRQIFGPDGEVRPDGYTTASQHDGAFTYTAGQEVRPDKWDTNWQEECAGGIHFYITRQEAELH
jgi:hypothetical protein